MAKTAEVVNELSVVKKLWNLSLEPSNQPYIARRGILPTLVKFLSSPDENVQYTAAETLRLLSSHTDNPEYMCKERGLVSGVIKKYTTGDGRVRTTLEKVIYQLRQALPESELPPMAAAAASSSSADSEGSPSACASAAPQDQYGQETSRPRTSSTLKKRSLVLALRKEEMRTAQNWEDLEALLVRTKGMVSWNVDTSALTVSLFLTTPTSAIVSAMQDAGYTTTVIEDSTPFTPLCDKDGMSGSFEDNQSRDAVDYLDDEIEDESAYKQSLVVQGEHSLTARLERQRKARAEAEQASRSVMNRFFSRLTAAFW